MMKRRIYHKTIYVPHLISDIIFVNIFIGFMFLLKSLCSLFKKSQFPAWLIKVNPLTLLSDIIWQRILLLLLSNVLSLTVNETFLKLRLLNSLAKEAYTEKSISKAGCTHLFHQSQHVKKKGQDNYRSPNHCAS